MKALTRCKGVLLALFFVLSGVVASGCSSSKTKVEQNTLNLTFKADGSSKAVFSISKEKAVSKGINNVDDMKDYVHKEMDGLNTDFVITRVKEKTIKEYDTNYLVELKLSRLHKFENAGSYNFGKASDFISNSNTQTLLKKWNAGKLSKLEYAEGTIVESTTDSNRIGCKDINGQAVSVSDLNDIFLGYKKEKIFTFLNYDFTYAEKIVAKFPGKIKLISDKNVEVVGKDTVVIKPEKFEINKSIVKDGKLLKETKIADNLIGYVVFTPRISPVVWVLTGVGGIGIGILVFVAIKKEWFTNKVIKKHPKLEYIKKEKQYYLMLIPGLLLLAIFCYGPMVGLYTAFTSYDPGDGIFGSEFVGLQNFINIFDPRWNFGRTLRNTFVIALLKFVLGYPASIILAILFSYLLNKRFKKIAQTASYLPYFISWVMISGIAYTILTSNNGTLNRILVAFGQDPVNWYNEPKYWWAILTITSIWKGMGYGSITFLAGLCSINPELYEAAKLDGAGRWQQIKNVTIPGLMPVISFTLILNMGNLIKDDYEQIIALVGENNAYVKETVSVIGTSIYNSLGVTSQFSAATALGLFQSLISLAFIIVSNRILVKRGHQGIW